MVNRVRNFQFWLGSLIIKGDRTCHGASDFDQTLYTSTAALEKVDRATQSNENIAILWRVPFIPIEP
jgi:hypothetical protein